MNTGILIMGISKAIEDALDRLQAENNSESSQSVHRFQAVIVGVF
jgi:hypothetical protein